MTRQTAAPLTRLPMSTSNRQAHWLVQQVASGELDINPPYQRGEAWTEDQRVGLMRSLLAGLPIPTLIINDRGGSWWTDTNAYDDSSEHGSYAVVDGKQRLLCLTAWFNGRLAIPASWINCEYIHTTEDTNDGPYVRYSGLTDIGRRIMRERILLPIGEATVATVRDEADMFLLVNGGGTPQSDADMARAARVAGKE